jgi:hypothetical protein
VPQTNEIPSIFIEIDATSYKISNTDRSPVRIVSSGWLICVAVIKKSMWLHYGGHLEVTNFNSQ